MVVTPTLKAAQVAQEQVGAAAFTSAWLVHQHGFRWDEDGHWSRNPVPRDALSAHALLLPGDLLLVDEAGMLDQDVARALLTIADETGARIAFVGDRHQLPAVGRGGVLDHAARWARPEACLELETVHRFTDPEYADLTLLMRTGQTPGEVFDMLHGAWADPDPPHRGRTPRRPHRRPRNGHRGHPRAGRHPQRRDPRPAPRHRPDQGRRSRHHRSRRATRRRRPDRNPTQRPRPRRGEPRPLDSDRH